ncbi:sensor histidine kinase [Paenibacillus sp. HB172176]|uniref:sensor histidine kinase n=1 Tax=Paenibacillus sp. HB172176 TaxID=2493690 RepID=UPI00143BDF98|nr:sensor histidine kinase [Paenibacillus sp. HB172176]
MKPISRSLFPQTLRNRLFASYILLILLPFGILNIYLFQKIEVIMQDKIAERSHDQLDQMNQSLEDIMAVAFKTLLWLEQDQEIQTMLTQPPPPQSLTYKHRMEEKFRSITNSMFITVPQVYFTMLDFQGNIYSSFMPREGLSFEKITSESWYQELIHGNVSRKWVDNDPNYVSPDLSTSPYFVSLYAILSDSAYKPYGVARISLDYSQWLTSIVRSNPEEQNYTLISKRGEVVGGTGGSELSERIVKRVASEDSSGFFVDPQSETMINYSKIESVDWYMVKQIPLDVLYHEINDLKQQFFLIFCVLTAAFIMITFIISKNITKPLSHLQTKMRDVISKNFKVKVSEGKKRGEVLELTRTFNTMTDDMNDLLQRVKQEQREREAVHVQMLLSQLNPHFLLNTLNIIKWLSIRKDATDIAEVSVALGSLLETSLNSEIDLIPLHEEIKLIEAFMHIQKYKHKQQIEVNYAYSESLRYALVPKLSLQPLVENAVKHAFASLSPGAGVSNSAGFGADGKSKGEIQIRISEGNERLQLIVADNGMGMEQSAILKKGNLKQKSTGIGLRNIRERLQLIYKEDSSFAIQSSDKGTQIRLEIPLLIAEPYEKGGTPHVEGAIG